jgi:hypothetical protein
VLRRPVEPAGVKRTSGSEIAMSLFDPLQKWGRGSATRYAEHRSNMNVINISAKKSEL